MANCVHVCVCAHMYVSMFGVCSVLACRGQRFCIIRATDTDTSRASVCVIECGVCVGVCMCVCMCVCLCVCVCVRVERIAPHRIGPTQRTLWGERGRLLIRGCSIVVGLLIGCVIRRRGRAALE